MKAKKQILMLVLAGLTAIPTLFAQSKKEKKELIKTMVREKVVSENYKINVNTAMPMRGRNISLSFPYSLEIRNDSVISQLPYFGRAYRIPYDGGKGLDFKAPFNDYKMEIDKKGNLKIKFSARSPEDVFNYRITIFSDGTTNIDVTMQNRQGISFRGELDLKPV